MSETVADEKNSETDTHTHQEEPILPFGVFFVVELDGVFIEENGLCLFEGNTMFLLILPVFALIPFEVEFIHIYIVNI